jgi:DNA-directed RNA polymerase II subunit RPB3
MPNNRIPKVEVIESRVDRLKFELSQTDVSMANSLRRIMISEVPTLCIDEVEFSENTSVLVEEILAHRVGFIPLRSRRPMKDWNYAHECDCGGDSECKKCSVTLTLDVDFDTIMREREQTDDTPVSVVPVTSRHLQVAYDVPDVEVVHFSSDAEARAIHDDEGVLIVKLGPGQRVSMTCTARKGIGKEHAKWSPVCTVALKIDPVLKINEEMLADFSEDQKAAFANVCPTGVFQFNEGNRTVEIVDAAACIFCKECIYYAEEARKDPNDPLVVEVKHSQDRFVFTIETTGALSPSEVVHDAFAVLQAKLKKMVRATMKLTAELQ